MILPPYFDKKSGQANTFLVAGAPVSQMVLAPLIRYLLEVYSLKGVALIHSGIILNGLIAMSFFHPVKWHVNSSSKEKPYPQIDTFQSLIPQENTSPTAPKVMHHLTVAPGTFDSMSGNRSVQKVRRSFSGSISSVLSAESIIPATLAFQSDEEEKSPIGMKPRGAKTIWRMLLRVAKKTKSDVTVLRQFKCVILAVTFILTQTTFLNFIMLLPFVAKAADHSLQDAARCIALLGVANLVIRLVVSPLSDWFSIRFSIMLGYFLRALGITGTYPTLSFKSTDDTITLNILHKGRCQIVKPLSGHAI